MANSQISIRSRAVHHQRQGHQDSPDDHRFRRADLRKDNHRVMNPGHVVAMRRQIATDAIVELLKRLAALDTMGEQSKRPDQ